jgi:type IV pilus assembly protein PilW
MRRFFWSKFRENRQKNGKAGLSYIFCSKGFTLVELLVVIAIFGVVAGSIYSVFVRSNRVYISQEEVVRAQQEARAALEILGREIRMAGLVAETNQAGGTYPIIQGAWGGSADAAIEVAAEDAANRTTTLAFKIDLVESDNQTDAVRYVYYWGDYAADTTRRRNLYRQSKIWDGPSSSWTDDTGERIFFKNIDGLTLNYELADGTQSTAPAEPDDIRGVNISVTAQTEHEVKPYEGGKGTRDRTLVSCIEIRNVGL